MYIDSYKQVDSEKELFKYADEHTDVQRNFFNASNKKTLHLIYRVAKVNYGACTSIHLSTFLNLTITKLIIILQGKGEELNWCVSVLPTTTMQFEH